MEHTIGQLQFDNRFLTAFRTGLAGIVWWHLMEIFTIAFCHPVAPVKEHPPRRISNRLGKVSVLYHVTRSKFLSNNSIKTSVVKKFGRCFRQKVKTLTRHNIGLLRQCVLCLIPPFALILFTRQIPVKFYEFAFGQFGKSEGWVSSRHQKSSENRACQHPHHKPTSGHISAYQALRKR